jgi:SAM-dependent methyltransferase
MSQPYLFHGYNLSMMAGALGAPARIARRRYYRMVSALTRNPAVRCNICGLGWRSFHDHDCGYGRVNEKTVCPYCGSHPRHRSMMIYLERAIPKDRKLSVLHIAPEAFFERFFRSLHNVDYVSADIAPGNAMLVEDITSMTFPGERFDFIFCSHVLEHVDDDMKAMREMRRVLKKGGTAIIDVPIDYKRERTYEDDSIKTPEERTEKFWQWDHLRLYGKDFKRRLSKAGFDVDVVDFVNGIERKAIRMNGLLEDPVHVCRR